MVKVADSTEPSRRPSLPGCAFVTGEGELPEHPHLVFVPGLMFVLTVISLNIMGEHARQRSARVSKMN